mgnify:CR=1 FL=1
MKGIQFTGVWMYKVELLKLARKNSWNHIKSTYFWRVVLENQDVIFRVRWDSKQTAWYQNLLKFTWRNLWNNITSTYFWRDFLWNQGVAGRVRRKFKKTSRCLKPKTENDCDIHNTTGMLRANTCAVVKLNES